MTTTINGTTGVTFPAGGVGNPASAVVGLTDTQTLTNKTLTSPTITGAVISTMASSVITAGTAVASTSGTSIDFTSIPSWVKRITVMVNGVSTSGTSQVQLQIGSGSVTTSGYISGAYTGAGTGATSGFILTNSGATAAANTLIGTMTLSLFGSNTWVANGVIYINSANDSFNSGISSALSGALDRVRITTVNGTDTFDAGSINILYE